MTNAPLCYRVNTPDLVSYLYSHTDPERRYIGEANLRMVLPEFFRVSPQQHFTGYLCFADQGNSFFPHDPLLLVFLYQNQRLSHAQELIEKILEPEFSRTILVGNAESDLEFVGW